MKSRSSVFSAAAVLSLAVLLVLSGCSSEEEEEKGPQSFEELVAQVVVKPEETGVGEPEQERERLLKVGVLGPKTGEDSAYGLMTFEGARLAAESFNGAGGVDGAPIEIVEYDNRSEQGATRTGMDELIKQGVVAIIGSPTGWSTFAPVYMANESSTVFISAGTRRHIGRSGPFVFRTSLPGQKAADELMEYATAEAGLKRFALVTVMEDEALSVASFFRMAAAKTGAEIKAEGHIFTADDVAAAVEEIKSAMPVDAVIFAGSDRSAIDFLEAARAAGLRLPLVGGEELGTETFLAGGDIVVGTLLYAGFSPLADEPMVRDFVEGYRKREGRPPATFVAEAYDAFMLIAEALKAAGTTRPSAVRKALLDIEGFHGLTGLISMDEEGEVVKSPYLLEVVDDGGSPAFSIVRSPF